MMLGSEFQFCHTPDKVAVTQTQAFQRIIDSGLVDRPPCISWMERRYNNEHHTPLHLAVIADNIEMVIYLIKSYNNKKWIDAKDVFGNTPLHEAVKRGNLAIALLLLNTAGCDANIPNKEGETAKGLAANADDLTMYHLIVNAQNKAISRAVSNRA